MWIRRQTLALVQRSQLSPQARGLCQLEPFVHFSSIVLQAMRKEPIEGQNHTSCRHNGMCVVSQQFKSLLMQNWVGRQVLTYDSHGAVASGPSRGQLCLILLRSVP